ncbi:MAG: nuclear transport factor 2 family protein [bacterium]|jgi:ketosteroid isomerase-like protein|nr:nuclear transport factor 2 family protein [candidate division KSB1 bacterium]MDH7560858.1 nuclear transport factor 2 family protein [bacterium]
MRMSRVEAAARLALGFSEAFNRHDLASIAELLDADCVLETAGPPPEGSAFRGKEAVVAFWERFFHQRPDVRLAVEEVSGLGTRSVLRWRMHPSGTSGTASYVRGVDIFTVAGGSIREQLSYVKGEAE